jgi:hypothetical protein
MFFNFFKKPLVPANHFQLIPMYTPTHLPRPSFSLRSTNSQMNTNMKLEWPRRYDVGKEIVRIYYLSSLGIVAITLKKVSHTYDFRTRKNPLVLYYRRSKRK